MQQAVRGTAALAASCHPGPTLTVTALAAVLAVAAGRDAPAVVGLTIAVLCGQLSVGWLNDLLDADRDAATGRTDKPVADGRVARRAVAVAAAVAAIAALGLTAVFGWRALAAHLLALGSAWAYDFGVKATAASVLPYAVSFGLLPLVVGPAPGWLIAAAATLGAAAHFANALPDLADDLATGVRGLPHRIGARATVAVSAALVVATGLVVLLAPPGPPPAGPVVTLAVGGLVLVAGLVRGGRAPFAAILLVALLDVVAVAWTLTA